MYWLRKARYRAYLAEPFIETFAGFGRYVWSCHGLNLWFLGYSIDYNQLLLRE
jgi:hypothetical protein